MPSYLRVKDKSTGIKQTIVAPEVLDDEIYLVLKQDALDENGAPLPPEFPTESASTSAATTKEK